MSISSAEDALSLAVRLAAVGFTISSIEQWTVRSAFASTGPFSSAVAQAFGRRVARSSRATGPVGVATRAPRWIATVLAVDALAGIALVLLGPFPLGGRIALAIAVTGSWLIRWRRVMASDGAEQMTNLILIAALIAVVPWPSHGAAVVATWFIAGQTVLSYTTAGVAKALSPTWRGRDAVALILGSEAYGKADVARLLRARPWLSGVAGRSVIAFECTFGAALLGPRWMLIAALVAGVAFHASCAYLMGLNNFLWAFPASYPCVWLVAPQLSPWW